LRHPDALRRGQILQHRATQITYGLAHFEADLLVNLAGAVCGPNVFPPQFVLSLGCTEQVRGQFRAEKGGVAGKPPFLDRTMRLSRWRPLRGFARNGLPLCGRSSNSLRGPSR
jgi:hypothetical protein